MPNMRLVSLLVLFRLPTQPALGGPRPGTAHSEARLEAEGEAGDQNPGPVVQLGHSQGGSRQG